LSAFGVVVLCLQLSQLREVFHWVLIFIHLISNGIGDLFIYL
jgi:hypothetical protein